MSTPDKNNPDGLGSYGRAPSRFVKRPKEKSEDQPNDATAAPMGHACQDQEVFDQEEQRQAQSPSPEKKILKPETPHLKDTKQAGELRKE